MAIRIFNTLTLKKEDFVPLVAGEVKMYVCGPTVYNLVHIGNMRGAIFFNSVRRFFETKGYKVTFVYNFTDVDDKIIDKAKQEKVKSSAIAEKYIAEFQKDFERLNLKKHDVNPRVTDHISEIVQTIEQIIEHGKAYVTDDGEVLCSIEKISGYGKLSHKNIEDLIAGARVEIGEKKKNPLDFALWKPAKPGEPKWPSPWGDGRPGWHIECSAMASKYLGDTFDIHGGGIDLIFPHHENEIAQSEAAHGGTPFVRYWMHNNFINMGKEKMSKSLGNITLARTFLDQYNAEILKFWFLQSHYRSTVEMSEPVINNAIHGLARIYSALCQAFTWKSRCEKAGLATLGEVNIPFRVETLKKLSTSKAFVPLAESLAVLPERVEKAFEDDFSTPEALAALFDSVRTFNAILRPGIKPSAGLLTACLLFIACVQDVGSLMALFLEEPHKFLVSLDNMLLGQKGLNRETIQEKVDARTMARQQKDFQKADIFREELAQLGISLQDGPDGTEWEVKK